MIINQKIIVSNYKCFDSDGSGFQKIMPINIIIGKNNSGKSSLIDLVKYLTSPNDDFRFIGRDNKRANIYIKLPLDSVIIKRTFSEKYRGIDGLGNETQYSYGKVFIGNHLTYELREKSKKFMSVDREYNSNLQNFFDRMTSDIKPPLEGLIFCHISAERDINSEMHNPTAVLNPNGVGAMNYIHNIVHKLHKRRLIENDLLKELNLIVNPEMEFQRILLEQKVNDEWELLFEDNNGHQIPLNKMGSGLKTVILVLLNLIVRPKIEEKTLNSYVFAFEELENNLHPSLQRKLFKYILDYSINNQVYFFITTHSNVVLDVFNSQKNTQIIHIQKIEDKSIANTLESFNMFSNVLNDLGIKASDILQSNGIIWVEGPSDRNYINKWLSLLKPDFKEGVHYSIMFYGGKNLSNLSFDYEWFDTNIIPILKINKNSFVIMDRDGKYINSKLNNTKNRIIDELGKEKCWITKGREIENYLSKAIVETWMKEKHSVILNYENDFYKKIQENLTISGLRKKVEYSSNKNLYSKEICDYIDESSLEFLDLKTNLLILIDEISKWNK